MCKLPGYKTLLCMWTTDTGGIVIALVIILSFVVGVVAGINIENLNHDPTCLAAEAVYNKAVSNFREDLGKGADESVLFADEYRKFTSYIEMQKACH